MGEVTWVPALKCPQEPHPPRVGTRLPCTHANETIVAQRVL